MNVQVGEGPQLQVIVNVTDWPENRRVQLVRLIDDLRNEVRESVAPSDPAAGWTKELVAEAVVRLIGARAKVQVAAIRLAVTTVGRVTREEIYELGGYPAGRSLKGFTRPVNRVVQEMRDEGLLPAGAAELLVPESLPGVTGYHQVPSFKVPVELIGQYASN